MLLPMAIACKKDDASATGSSDVQNAMTGGEDGPVDLLATIPSANYNGREFIISITGGKHEAEVCVTELTGDTANDTIYK